MLKSQQLRSGKLDAVIVTDHNVSQWTRWIRKDGINKYF
jgi:hypothetical protein